MKKGILLALVLACGMSSVTRASFDATSVSSRYTSCIASQSHDISYYIPKGTDAVKFQPYDEFTSSSAKILSTNNSKVEIWNPNGVIGSDCNQWSYLSNVYPGNNVRVLYLASNTKCSFSRPNYTKASDPNKVDAQIHYALRYYDINSSSSNKVPGKFEYTTVGGFTSNPKEYTCYPGGTTVSTPSNCPSSTLGYDSTMKSHDGECLNYRIFWCGDGIVNNPNGTKNFTNGTSGEECDPNDSNKTGWGNLGCSTSCKPLNSVCGDGVKNGSEKCDYKDSSKSGWGNLGCSTSCEPLNSVCGDGVKNGSEKCDYKDSSKSGWGDLGCSTSCEPLNSVCGDGVKNGSEKCDYKDSSKSGWGDLGCSTSCEPLNSVCGDGVKNGSEKCDYKDSSKSGWGNLGCSTSCEPLNSVCGDGVKNGSEKCDYKDSNKTGWGDLGCSTSCEPLNSVCGDGVKNGNEKCDPKDSNKTGWGDLGCSTSCEPLNSVCGDGVKNGNEKCDPKDSNKTGWGDLGCSTSCEPLNSVCGDGVKNGNEKCDPKDSNKTGWGDLGCSTSCEPLNSVCGDGVKNGNEKCDPKDSNKTGWGDLGCSTSCEPLNSVCGDGVKNGNEECDPSDTSKTGWGDLGCSATCKPLKSGCGDGKKEGSEKCDYNDSSKSGWGDLGCSTSCEPLNSVCGDGVKNGNEKCDPKDSNKTGWGDLGCSTSCEPLNSACGDGVKNGNEKCDPKDSNKTGWGDLGCSTSCEPLNSACGDGVKNGNEECDYNDLNKEGWGDKTCNASCKLEDLPPTPVSPECNTGYSGQTKYTSNSDAWLTSSMPLCKPGTVVNFKSEGEPRTFTWSCSNDGEIVNGCNAKQEWCGDGQKNGTEDCDPKEKNTSSWGDKTCNSSCKLVEKGKDPDLWIKKSIEGGEKNKNVKDGDQVVFLVEVGNKGGEAKDVVVKDMLPPFNLEYIKSEAPSGVTIKEEKQSNGQMFIIFSGINLSKDQKIQLKIYTKVKITTSDINNCNTVSIDGTDNPINDQACAISDKKIKVDKSVDKKKAKKGDVLTYTLLVTALDGVYDEYEVADDLPDGLQYISYEIKDETTSVTVLSEPTGSNLKWKLSFPNKLSKNGHFKIVYQVKIVGDQKSFRNCVKDGDCIDVIIPEEGDLNISKYVSKSEGGPYGNSWTLDGGLTVYFKIVVDGATNPFKKFQIKDQIDKTKFVYSGLVSQTLHLHPGAAGTISMTENRSSSSVDLGWDVTMTEGEFLPGDRVEIIFKAWKARETTDKNEACVYYSRSDIEQGSKCGEAEVGFNTPPPPPPTRNCGNGFKNVDEECDWGKDGGIILNGRLFRNDSTIIDSSKAGKKCNSDCTIGGNGEYKLPECFNLQNGSISIMKGEVLPFYWNLKGFAGPGAVDDEDNKFEKEQEEFLKENYILNESDTNNMGTNSGDAKISIESMKCTFRVYGPGASNYAYEEIVLPCINPDGWEALEGGKLDSYVQQNKDGWFEGSVALAGVNPRNVFRTLNNQKDYPLLWALSSKSYIAPFGQTYTTRLGQSVGWNGNNKDLGEYKIALEKIEAVAYWKEVVPGIISDGENEPTLGVSEKVHSIPIDALGPICEVDFAVTEPYIIQKSPFGISKQSSDDLSRYKYKNGGSFMNLFNINGEGFDNYKVPDNVLSLFEKFKNKYDRIAVKVENDLYKVPGKEIYLYKGRSGLSLEEIFKNKVPDHGFSLIAMGDQQINVKGNMYDKNVMIMTNGNIAFDGSKACNSQGEGKAGQIVRGIFYAGSGFISINDDHLKNTLENMPKSNWERCNYGNLHIKGVAIGNLSEIMERRRSELYTWFWKEKDYEKREVVENGATVLIETDSSLWNNLPPGAEEFNSILSMYRN